MSIAEIETDALTERANARQALADAIAGVDSARQRLASAKSAVETGWDSMIDAGNRLEARKAGLPQLSGAPAADAVLAGLATGSAVEARSPRALAEDEIAALEGSRDQLRRDIETGEREVESRKRAVEDARLRAHRAAVAVLRASGAAAKLLHGLTDLQEQVIRRRVALRFLLSFKAVPADVEGAVKALLSENRELPGLPGYGDWRGHPTHADWWQALATLERDADAPLPG